MSEAPLDLLPLELSSAPLAFPCASPVRELADFGAKKKRRRRRASDDDDVAILGWEDAFASETPLVLRAAADVANWPALERWTPSYLADHIPAPRVHVSAHATVQMMSAVQPLASALPELRWHRPWAERNVSGAEFWSGAAPSAENRSFHYFFSPVGDLPAALRRDVDTSRLSTPFQPVVEANLWAGSAGVASPLHFDAAHNVYAQLRGRKRFVLFPADVSDDLYVFPRLHPSTRQSRLDLRALPPAGFGRFHRRRAACTEGGGVGGGGALHAREVVLTPGDVLYIPPYVWHRVATLADDAPAVSVSVLTQSTAIVAYPLLKAHPLPFPPDWSRAQRLAALGEYVLALAALPPPLAGATTADAADASFACAVGGRCACAVDAHEAALADGGCTESRRCAAAAAAAGGRRGAAAAAALGAAAVRTLLASRFDGVGDEAPPLVSGLSAALATARDALAAELRWQPPPPLPPAAAARLRAHARALRAKVEQLPLRGAPLSAAVWAQEAASLIEDVVSATLSAREAEAFLRWVVGDPPFWV